MKYVNFLTLPTQYNKNNPKVQENLLFLRNTSENAIYHDKKFFPTLI